jgi:hypothetical protein
VLVVTAMILHYGFALLGLLPTADQVRAVTEREFFAFDYTFWINLVFAAITLAFLGWKIARSGWNFSVERGLLGRTLFALAMLSYLWLAAGVLIGL